MSEIVFFLEERSAKELLQGLLSRMVPAEGKTAKITYKVYEGKSDLQNNLKKDLQHYNVPNASFIILHDQDNSDCHELKETLADLCHTTGKSPIIRIACRELESWYLAQLNAVEHAFGIPGLSNMQRQRKFRNPDLLGNPDHILSQITKNKYQKISGSRILGKLIDPNCEVSTSFKYFIRSVKALLFSA